MSQIDQQEYQKRLQNIVNHARQGNPDAMYALAVIASKEDIDKSLAWMNKAIEAGHVGAVYTLGAWYIQGTLLDMDLEKGHALLKQASEQKYYDADILRAVLYAHGMGVEQDWDKALKLTMNAAKAGFGKALGQLAFLCFMAGERAEGEKLMQAAAERLDPMAMYAYGKHVLEGNPAADERQKALTYIAIAGKMGRHQMAQEYPGSEAAPVPDPLPALTDYYQGVDWDRVETALNEPPVLAAPKENKLNDEPFIATYPGFLSGDECDYMIASAARHLTRSEVLDPVSGKQIQHEYRSSSDMRFWHAFQDLVIYCLILRICQATDLPLENHEMLGVLKYEPGQQYKPHGDFLTSDAQGRNPEVDRSGQRVKTFIIYLNEGFEGGETEFVNINIKAKGARGEGIMFTNTLEGGMPDERSVHAGKPIVKGVKWLSTIWIRDRKYKFKDFD